MIKLKSARRALNCKYVGNHFIEDLSARKMCLKEK